MSDSAQAWQQGGGGLRTAVEALASAKRPGALLAIEVERRALTKARETGLQGDREADLLRKAWDEIVATLPANTVGRRTSWSRFEFVLEGPQGAIAPHGTRLLTTLKSDQDLRLFDWHLVFTEIFTAEPERTFFCDPGYDLQAVEGRCTIAWVQAYVGADWRESRRYPTVSFFPFDEKSSS